MLQFKQRKDQLRPEGLDKLTPTAVLPFFTASCAYSTCVITARVTWLDL